ncbi:MAG: glycosyltransferase, partial [Sphingobacteriales bacterium]
MAQEKKIAVLFIGVVSSEKLITELISSKLGAPNPAAQKYHRLLLEGMAVSNELFSVNVISMPEYFVGYRIDGYKETARSVHYTNLPYQTNKIFKLINNSFQIWADIWRWRAGTNKLKRYIMYDPLHLSTSVLALLFSRLLGIKLICTVTDLPEYMYVLNDRVTFSDKIIYKLKNFLITSADAIIVLTKPMISYFSLENRNHILIEGLVDHVHVEDTDNEQVHGTKIIHYSGGLFEKFGVKALIDAFMLLEDSDIELELFGKGDLESYIHECIKKDERIKYYGLKENNFVVSMQKRSFILVNPRFSFENYTKYSFPSKTIEYMASGVPLLTNKLPGIPEEYFNYVYHFDGESVEDYRKKLEHLLRTPYETIREFGIKAKASRVRIPVSDEERTAARAGMGGEKTAKAKQAAADTPTSPELVAPVATESAAPDVAPT